MTVTLVKNFEAGNLGKLRAAVFDVTFDASYPTNGELFDHTVIPGKYFKAVAGCMHIGGNAAAAAYMYQWNTATRKLQIFYPSGGDQASPAALADPVYTLVAGGAADNDTIQATPGRGKELANATDASTLSVRLLVFGY